MADSAADLANPSFVQQKIADLTRFAEQIASRIRENNGRLIELDELAKKIPDATKRAEMLARIKRNVERQVVIVRAWRALGARVEESRRALSAALRAIGFTLPGLDALPVVGIGIGLGVLAAAGFAATIWAASSVQSKSIENDGLILKALLAGKVSASEAARMMDANARKADTDTSVLGLKSILREAVPVLLLVGGLLVLPHVLRMVGGRRFGASAA